jgi:hypothetical protein
MSLESSNAVRLGGGFQQATQTHTPAFALLLQQQSTATAGAATAVAEAVSPGHITGSPLYIRSSACV